MNIGEAAKASGASAKAVVKDVPSVSLIARYGLLPFVEPGTSNSLLVCLSPGS